MNGLPYMPVYVRDMLSGTRAMDAASFGCFVRLLLHSWDEGPLPDDVESLDNIAPGTKACWPRISRKFEAGTQPGTLVNKRLELERAKALAGGEGRSAKATAAAKARWDEERRRQSELQAVQQAEPPACSGHAPSMQAQQAEERIQTPEQSRLSVRHGLSVNGTTAAHEALGNGMPAVPASIDRQRRLLRAVDLVAGPQSPVGQRFRARAVRAVTAIDESGRDPLAIAADVRRRADGVVLKRGPYVLSAIESEAGIHRNGTHGAEAAP